MFNSSSIVTLEQLDLFTQYNKLKVAELLMEKKANMNVKNKVRIRWRGNVRGVCVCICYECAAYICNAVYCDNTSRMVTRLFITPLGMVI